MSGKMRIKMGPIEIEYEGSEAFLKEELPEILKAVSNLYSQSGISIENEPPNGQALGQPVPQPQSLTQTKLLKGTTGTFAAKLGAKSGPELILTAAAQLTFGNGNEKFSRKELISSMKSASAYFKQTYIKNLTASINGLVKNGKLLEMSKDVYALSADTRSDMEQKLGN